MKYTVIIERLVRVKEYETLKIGLHREYDDNQVPSFAAYKEVWALVCEQIDVRLKELRADDKISS